MFLLRQFNYETSSIPLRFKSLTLTNQTCHSCRTINSCASFVGLICSGIMTPDLAFYIYIFHLLDIDDNSLPFHRFNMGLDSRYLDLK